MPNERYYKKYVVLRYNQDGIQGSHIVAVFEPNEQDEATLCAEMSAKQNRGKHYIVARGMSPGNTFLGAITIHHFKEG